MSDHDEIEPKDGPDYCDRCGVTLGIGRHMVPPARGMEGTCLECATEMDGTGREGTGMNEEIALPWVESYREAMRDSGRGHLLS